ncbi:helix-turn-helix domain-containing protein [Bacteroides sp. 51]|uniref:helix-turn-helix domain-containing protein n=1 Tax=Bacteroides sp. 51 TaxID=2302938 RepID=UPI0013D19597|nr:helix-turn-helix domain-containing protein [Bacteroides sp. 51]NDV82268.1 DNA-binding protein [Bacteroides sp. 51]
MLPRLYTTKEVADYLGINRTTLQNMRGLGEIDFLRIGNGRGVIRFTEEHILKYLKLKDSGSTLSALKRY